MIAIKIKNPARVAKLFGECAGDFKESECQWWVGTKDALVPSSMCPPKATVVEGKVKFCGGGAFLVERELNT